MAAQFTWNYEELMKLTNLSMDSIYQHKLRRSFDPNNLGSICLFLARYGRQDFRIQLVMEAIARDKAESTAVKEAGRRKLREAGV